MYEIQLTERITGYSKSSARGGEMVSVQVSGATSTEDGDLHIKYLEGFPQTILSLLNIDMTPSDVKTMIVIISKELKASVYINEVEIYASAFVKAKKVEKGQSVGKDDISGFERIKLRDIVFPSDHGFFCVLPCGWDRAFLFDFSPLDLNRNEIIDYDVERFIGSYFSYLLFKSFHKISDKDWENLLSQNWFPFYSLKFSSIEAMVNHSRAGWAIDDLLEIFEKEAIAYAENWIPSWRENSNFTPYIGFLEKALERHRASDFISSSSILYPKIEALIRQSFITDNPDKQGRRQDTLIEHLTEKATRDIAALTTYLPDKFKTYLERCYFKDFSAASFDNDVSRHSVAHGASSLDKFSKKASLLGFLIIFQIFQYLQLSSKRSKHSDASGCAGD